MKHHLTKLLFTITSLYRIVSGNLEGRIVGGDYARIEDFPHSANLGMSGLLITGDRSAWRCGSSIINQNLLLTAAHCFEGFEGGTMNAVIIVSVGSENNEAGYSVRADQYAVHADYDDKVTNDIAIVHVKKRLPLGDKVKRVVLMKNPPYNEEAVVAGWGLINDITPQRTKFLKYLIQKTFPRNVCMNKLGVNTPLGTICASRPGDKQQYPAKGDSGSALVVRKYIQIGIVSYSNNKKSQGLAMYTDIGYFYSWIMRTSINLYCGYI